MVSPPPLPAAGDGADARGNDPEAATAGATIRLTASAERYAKANDLKMALVMARPGAAVATGDVMSFRLAGRRHDFLVAQRAWIFGEDHTARLELTLDHPARRGA